MRKAIEYYNALLARDPAATREMAERIEAEKERRNLRFGGELIRTALRPHLVTSAQVREMRRTCRVLFACFAKVEKLALENPEVLTRLGFEGEERELVWVDHGYPGSAIFSRLDCFYDRSSFRFVELNVDSPGGAAYLDELHQIYLNEPLVMRFETRFKLQACTSRDRILAALLTCFRQWGGTGTPTIAIVDWKGVSTEPEFEILRQHFEAAGYPALVCDPREMVLRRDRLTARGRRIDILYKRVVVSELLARRQDSAAMIEGAKRNAVCMVNPFRGKLLNVKALFDILTHERYRPVFTRREHQVLRRHIPWTRRVEEAKTYYRGSKIDLPVFIRRNRENLILKPNDEYGGKGLYVGWECTDSQWDEAVGKALADCYVVQEKVNVPEAEYPVWENGELKMASFRYDTNPYFFAGEMGGCLCRLSTSALLNVTAGGGLVPTFEVRAAVRARRRRARS
ncbi:MAG: hypothetical protein AB1714_30555 [Acidobacteriota bacterium]